MYKCIYYSLLHFALPFDFSLGFNLLAMLDRFARMWCRASKARKACHASDSTSLASSPPSVLSRYLPRTLLPRSNADLVSVLVQFNGGLISYFVSMKSALDSPLSSKNSFICSRWPPYRRKNRTCQWNCQLLAQLLLVLSGQLRGSVLQFLVQQNVKRT